MDEILKDKLRLLRQHLPSMGLKEGVALLEKTNGDIDAAENLFKTKMQEIVIVKTGVAADMALKHLQKNNFDIALALRSIDEERYTLAERILKRYKDDKKEALRRLADAVSDNNNIKREFWLDFDDLAKQPPEIFCVLAVVEWLNYESWEDLSGALYFNFDLVIEKIEKELSFAEIAETLKKAKQIHEAQYEVQITKLKKEGWMSPTPEFLEQWDLFEKQRPILIDKLYEFVQKNIDSFTF
jgi:hypothetical protein